MSKSTFDGGMIDQLDLWKPISNPEIDILIRIFIEKRPPFVIEGPDDSATQLL